MKIGLIGGTGMYDADLLENSREIQVETPYGKPSQPVTAGKLQGVAVVVIPRHGKGHKINPTNVNYRANIWAMKELGVTRIIAPCAVGSLRKEIKPGDLVFVDQFIDRTTKRASTFYDKDKVAHVPLAYPFCGELRQILAGAAKELKLLYHSSGTNIVVEGPRFSTRAESELFRSWKADTINMTMVPEAVLAREAEICYAAIAQVTDYDCWKDTVVDVNEVITTLRNNVEKTKRLITAAIAHIPEERSCDCGSAMKGAFL